MVDGVKSGRKIKEAKTWHIHTLPFQLLNCLHKHTTYSQFLDTIHTRTDIKDVTVKINIKYFIVKYNGVNVDN